MNRQAWQAILCAGRFLEPMGWGCGSRAYTGRAMYVGLTTRRKDGKVRAFWRLVRPVRVGKKVVRQTIAHLGDLDAQDPARADCFSRNTPEGAFPSTWIASALNAATPLGMCGSACRSGGPSSSTVERLPRKGLALSPALSQTGRIGDPERPWLPESQG